MINLFENLCPHKTHTQILIALLVIIAKTVSSQDVLQHVRRKKKLCYISVMEYYLVIKINKLSWHKNTWMILKHILLSERSQSIQTTYYVVPIIWQSGRGKTIEIVKKDWWLPGVPGRGRAEQVEHRRYFRAVTLLYH